MGIRVIVDSGADLPASIQDKVIVAPLTIHFGEKEYRDGIDLTKDEFYNLLISGSVFPKTSQVSPGAFADAIEKVKKDRDQAVIITLSSGISGTFQSAMIAKGDDEDVIVIDSETVCVGSGVLVQYAVSCIEAGMTLKELETELNRVKKSIVTVAVLDTLEFLQRGGRISKTAAIAGGLLNIKPVIAAEEGKLVVLGKARGSKKANNFLMEKTARQPIDYSMPILLAYSGTDDTVLQTYIQDSRILWENLVELEWTQIGTAIGTHAGPGAYAVAYFAK